MTRDKVSQEDDYDKIGDGNSVGDMQVEYSKINIQEEWPESESIGKQEGFNMQIPNAEDVASSPELVFGENTITMIDEFMKNEMKTQKTKKKGIRRIIAMLSCCRSRNE